MEEGKEDGKRGQHLLLLKPARKTSGPPKRYDPFSTDPVDVVGEQPLANVGDFDYGSQAFWEKRYALLRPLGMEYEEEWYIPPKDCLVAMSTILRDLTAAKVLVLGCGLSQLSAALYDAGFPDIVNVDLSIVVTEMCREKHMAREGMRFFCLDATDMSMFVDDSFDLVVDKGMADAARCRVDAESAMRSLCEEVQRVLVPDGKWVSFSVGEPVGRRRSLTPRTVSWGIETQFCSGGPPKLYRYVMHNRKHLST